MEESKTIVRQQYLEMRQLVEGCESACEIVGSIAQEVVTVLKKGNKILSAGNGGSAADAFHLAEELVGRYRSNRRALPAISLAADPTALTCIGNDFGFEKIFSRQIEALGQPGDLFVGYSTSGRSANLIEAVQACRSRGLRVVLFLGKDGGPLAGQGDYEWIVPHQQGARIQELHTWAMHAILEVVEVEFV